MKLRDLLRDLLSPADDGRAFTEAVLLRATGALHRRRSHGAGEPVLGWLERWARPWVIAALMGAAMLALVPALPHEVPAPSGTHALSADAVTALLPVDVAAAVLTEDEER